RETRHHGGGRKPSVNLGEPILDLVGGKPVQHVGKALANRSVALAQQRGAVGQGGAIWGGVGHGGGT
ncbi:hypothetical protein NL487_28655, partial [Klebsiella pneumoniae]|nr:hypothetical protein [Klebsiella pneumoniae]